MVAHTRIDPHVKVLDAQVIEQAKRAGLDAIVYAPHFTRLPDIKAKAAAFSDPDLRVLPGRELFCGPWHSRRHVLAIGLEEPVPDFLTLEGALRACERQDATVLVPHPMFLTISLDAATVRRYRDRLDAIEIANPKFLPHHARRARRLAAETGLPAFGSSYAHLRTSVGEIWTEIPREISSVSDLQNAFTDAAIGNVHRKQGIDHLRARAGELGHLLWENTWEKVDRVVVDGMEPTHPHHPAYEGRYDAVAVY